MRLSIAPKQHNCVKLMEFNLTERERLLVTLYYYEELTLGRSRRGA